MYHLMRVENPMHTNIASVHWERWQTEGCIRISVKFVQVASNLVWEHSKLLIISQLACITMEYTLPVKGGKALWLIISEPRAETVC